MRLTGTPTPDRPLLVVATEQEASALDDRLPVLVTGVGKVRAAAAVSSVLADLRPSSVINLGTAGALRPHLTGIQHIGLVIQHDLDGAAIAALTGEDPAPPLHLGQGPTLATGDRLVTGGPLRDELAQIADLVDMEGWAVAFAARRAGIDVALIKLISDDADADAARTWAQTVRDHAVTLAAWVKAEL
jgi:adenosylhomocysteine nucleosidase